MTRGQGMRIFHSTSNTGVKVLSGCAIVGLVSLSAAIIGVAIVGTGGVGRHSLSRPLPIKSVPIKLKVGTPLTHYNMTLFPVYSADKGKLPRPIGHGYSTLGEALKKKQLFVKEKPDAQVSEVHLTNTSSKAVYLMAGDIILGGQQDREIARDTIVPARTKNYVVDVFCVEQGRWEGKSKFTSGETASSSLRYETQRYKEQGKVWDKVKKEADYTKSESSSGTYRAVAANKVTQAQIAAYTKDFSRRLSRDEKALGVVVAINGKMAVSDVFADPQLFQQQLSKLLKSYALDAVQEQAPWKKLEDKPGASHPVSRQVSITSAQQFLKAGETGGERVSAKTGVMLNSERENQTTITFDSMAYGSSRNTNRDTQGASVAHRNIFRKQ
jgi:hypothetical protein